MTNDERMQRESRLIATIKKKLPEFAKACADDTEQPRDNQSRHRTARHDHRHPWLHARIRSGRPVNLPEFSRARQIKVFYGQRDLIAIATRVAGTLFHPKIVLCGRTLLSAAFDLTRPSPKPNLKEDRERSGAVAAPTQTPAVLTEAAAPQ